jgi:hypothetical protein
LLDNVIVQASRLFRQEQSHSIAPVHSFLRSELGALLPLHISLSAPLVLKTEEKESFEEEIGNKISTAKLGSFAVRVNGVSWVSNYDRTRYFLVLKLGRPKGNELNRLLNICNTTALHFGLTQLYNSDKFATANKATQNATQEIPDRSDAFHISIAWTLQKPTEKVKEELAQYNVDLAEKLKVHFNVLKLKIGNTVVEFSLD